MKQFSNLDQNSSNHTNLEWERQLLLDLGNDITKVRDKNDLIVLFSDRIKSLMHFTHTIVTLIDRKDETYKPFLLDHRASAIKDHPEYDDMVKACFPLDEPFIQSVVAAGGPVDFFLADIVDAPQSPAFLRVNFEKGIRHVLMTTLRTGDQPIGFIHIYTDQHDGFSQEFKDIVQRITPQLSSAVSNIIKNEEILQKENEKSFLLDFSNDMTAVRSRDDLAVVVKTALRKLNPEGGYVIRKINEDGLTMSAYLYDTGASAFDPALLERVLSEKYPINDGLQNRILDSYIPLLFNVGRELQRGYNLSYLNLWENMGFKTMVGIALRNGNANIGLLWLSIDEINIPILQGICSQIAIAMGNIMANEDILRRQAEQQLMLTFSNDITGVKSKSDLDHVVSNVLQGLFQTRIAVMYLLAEDQVTLRPYLFDRQFFQETEVAEHEEFYSLNINEQHIKLVFESNQPILLDIDETLEAKCLKLSIQREQRGINTVYASALRLGEQNLGMVWMLGERISGPLLQGICAQISTAVSNVLAHEQILRLKRELENENDYLKQQLNQDFEEIVGGGEAMQQVYRLISLVAESNSTVLLLGETGTGKELIAKAVHNASSRKEKLMIKVNCAAMPASLIESELFGHERGAFTGAVERRIGKFELANNSTLFLDEVGEMPLETQVKLLRVLQEKEMERVGGKTTIKLNVRIIAATNRDLEAEVKAGRFRSDLYYRLNVFPIKLPPLRDRREDIESLAGFFLSKFSKSIGKKTVKLSANALRQLQAYLWPGNVRELEHLIERSVILATGPMITEFFLPPATGATTEDPMRPSDLPLEEVERMHIIQILRRCGGKISGIGGAAEILGIPGNTLHSKMRKLGISKADYYAH
ncbi:sigma-54-dependent Fis family transcriptional regulator [Dyadobacter fermentans]|uniref:sigma-54-dependent Fis family transcriptional regulator n=1 Tax=Dyadobacter fermentans TaxID=94254 RepID=UPI001CC12B92|nr:sigma 54-interacting transcriptional regulator [Dyadobacter fermentans]MBZ1360424.1 sigma 54-interacting transcriptional regulator [Dyadobacter fermentans]